MNKFIYWLGSWAVLSCASGTGGARAPSAPAPVLRNQPPAPVREAEAARPTLEERDPGERDRVFVENAERAIGEYSEFIARAGENAEYARAVLRSREQIEDLQAAIDFVRAGAAQRAALPNSPSQP